MENRSFVDLIELEINLHPKLQFIDLCKLLFQSNFGPSHYLKNTDQLNEIHTAVIPRKKQIYQLINWKYPLYRVNLDAYKYYNKPPEKLIQWANITLQLNIFPIEDYNNLLDNLLHYLRNHPNLNHLYNQGIKWNRNNMNVHHSTIYNREYNPEYIVLLINDKS